MKVHTKNSIIVSIINSVLLVNDIETPVTRTNNFIITGFKG